jgi:hypothetical protein
MPAIAKFSPAQAANQYHERGFVLLHSFFEPQVLRALADAAERLWNDDCGLIARENLRCRFMPHHQNGESLFECFDPVIDLSPAMASAACDKRLLDVLSHIYGEQAHLFKDKLIFKPAGARGYPLHQDYIAWEGFPKSFLTVLIPIDPATEENGCTVVYEGYHQSELFTPADGKFHPTPRECVSGSRRVALEMQPGDIAIFHGFTPHESNPNRTLSARRQLYLSYNAHRDGGNRREAHYREFHVWLRAKHPPESAKDCYFA